MYFGTVKHFDHDRGYGFIVPDKGQKLPPEIVRDVFVHASTVTRCDCGPLAGGDRLQFDICAHRGRMQACELRRIDEPVRYGT